MGISEGSPRYTFTLRVVFVEMESKTELVSEGGERFSD